MSHPTLLRPQPPDPAKSPIENDLEVIEVSVLGPDIYTNARKPWHPPGARGIYGGSVIAMSLAAGQRTVDAGFAPHSCHCYFLLAGNGDVPIFFHVERVRDGRSFITRTVQARQRGRCIFTITMSFVRVGATPPPLPALPFRTVRHAAAMPASRPPLPPPDFDDANNIAHRFERALAGNAAAAATLSDKNGEFELQPVMAGPMRIVGGPDAPPHLKKSQQWVRMRGKISEAGGRAAHLSALAYLSDRYFIGTICRIHRLWRLPFSLESVLDEPGADADDVAFLQANPHLKSLVREYIETEGCGATMESYRGRPAAGMVVSLDHTIYYHEPDRVRADEWMLVEMESPWADEGRGVVTQRVFNAEGMLLATCLQEGIVRLAKEKKPQSKL